MDKAIRISESEWEVMKIVWDKKEVTSNEIIEEFKDKRDWKAATVKTLISRLLNKEAISFNKKGKEYLYYPLIEEEKTVIEESMSFINRVFNGSISDLLLNFVKSEKLTEEDIDELKEILNSKNKEE